jgi:hypothetical protein
MQRKWNLIISSVLLFLGFFTAVGFVIIASSRELTDFENILFQAITFFLGIIGALGLGNETSKKNAEELIKQSARPAFRRSLGLYQDISQIAYLIAAPESKTPGVENPEVIGKIEVLINSLIRSADYSLEDWRDIIPEDVKELEKILRKEIKTE